MKIDAHQHYWDLDHAFIDWPTPDLEKIYRNFSPDDLQVHLHAHQIDYSVVVQTAPNIEETHHLLKLADKHDSIAGVVGWVDLASPDMSEQFAKFRQHPKFVGIRPMLQSLPEDDWILKPEVKKNLEILVEEDFPIDILIYPRHLPYIVELLKEFPTLRAVIDHCAKPHIKEREFDEWAKWMEQVAAYDSVMCKLSGIVTEADHHQWNISDFTPYIHHVIDCFGARRIMYGSDWPVCLLAASYDDVVNILKENLPRTLSDEEEHLLFGENARQFYQLQLTDSNVPTSQHKGGK